MRCFISIELPENIKSQIFHAFEKLKNSKLCQGNFTKKNNLHLTLKFFRNISQEKLEQIKKTLKEIDFPQFPVETGKIGFFPNEKYIKILWIELIASDFEFLKKQIDEKLKKLNLNGDEKSFISHITLVRINSIKDKKEFFKKIIKIAPKKKFFISNQFSLVKSILKRDGPEYKILENFQMRMRN
jgi:2'-5' RNA ligase